MDGLDGLPINPSGHNPLVRLCSTKGETHEFQTAFNQTLRECFVALTQRRLIECRRLECRGHVGLSEALPYVCRNSPEFS